MNRNTKNTSADSSAVLQALADDSGEIVAPRRVTVPPEPNNQLTVWTGLVISLLLCAPLLLIGVFSGAEVHNEQEAQALITSRETWRRVSAGAEGALWIPRANGLPQINPPPMTTWCHLGVWLDLDAQTASNQTLIRRARLASVIWVLVALVATYWAGLSIGGVRTARFAALVFGTTALLLTEGWLAWSGPLLLGFSTLAVASGLWAIRPLKDAAPAPRRVIGWLISGLALGAAILTHGPGAMLFVLPVLFAAIVLTARRRFGNTLGLLFSIMVGLFVTAPWYLHVLGEVPGAWNHLAIEHRAPSQLFVLSGTHAKLLVVLMPWIVWVIGALCQPFLKAEDRRHRRQLLIAWFWAVLTFVVLSIPAAEDPQYLLPLMPAVALLAGQLWAHHVKIASERQEEPGINRLRVPHWVLIILLSFIGSAYAAFQDELIAAGYLDRIELPGLSRWVWLGVGGVLVMLAALGARWHFKWRVRSAAYTTVAWMVVVAAVGLWSYCQSHHHRFAYRQEAERLAEAMAQRELVYLHDPEKDLSLHPAFVFYVDRPVQPLAEDRLRRIGQQPEPVAVVVTGDRQAARLRSLNFLPAGPFRNGFTDGYYKRAVYVSPVSLSRRGG